MTHKIARSFGAWLLGGFSSAAFAASMAVGFTPSNTVGNNAAVTANVTYAGVTALGNGTQIVACYDNTKLTFVSAAHANPPGEFQPPLPAGPVEQGAGALCVAPANRQVLFTFVSFGGTWPSNPAASGTLAPAGNIGTIAFTTANPFNGSTNVVATENTALGGNYALGAATGTLSAVVVTAPTVSPLTNTTLTGGTGSVPVNVATSGANGGSLALVCTIPAGTASIAITGGANRTIAAGTAVGANAPAIGLSCTPQATLQTATLTCTQTTTPAPNPANLTSTVTCPAVAPASITYTVAPTTLTFTGVTSGTPTATQSVTVQANAANTAALNVASCAFGGANAADFSFSPVPTFPVSVAAGASTALPVRFTPAAADSAARAATLTCQTPNATAVGASSFVVTLNGANPAPTPIAITAGTAPGPVTLPGYIAGPTPGTSSTGLSFNTTGGPSSLSCVASGAGYSATPNPLNLVVGTAGTVTVTYTGTALGTFAGTLTCTPTAPATGGPFVYNLSTTVRAAAPAEPAIQVPTMGTFGLGLMGLLIAGFAGFMQRRRLK